MPKISVILTSFNHEKYTREAIDSVLNQTFTDFELIIWDDASKDDSWAVINSYSDQRIQAFRNEVTKRGIYGVNKSITEVATGEYIAIHHSDDVWELGKLEKQVAFLDANPETGAVFTWAQVIDENGVESENSWFQQENKTQWQWLQLLFNECNQLCHPSVLIRKHCYEEVGVYRYGLGQTGDAEMWSRVLIKFPIHVIPENLTKHRKFTDMSNTSGDRIEVQIRTGNEWNLLRENYLAISSFEDIVATFPSLERFRTPEGFDNKFLLGMACLYECKQRSAWQLGLKWLFDLLNDKASHKKIRELYSFSYMDFIRLTSEFDVYFIEGERQIGSLNQALAERYGQIGSLNQAVDDGICRIGSLNQALAERYGQIVSLNQVVVERDGQVFNLNQAVADRDGLIAEQNGQIGSLNQAVAESQQAIAALFSSSSWRITKPLRFVSCLLSGTLDEPRCIGAEGAEQPAPLPGNPITERIQAERDETRDEQKLARELDGLPEDFDRGAYLKLYPDLAGMVEEGQDIALHYLRSGRLEGRKYTLPEIDIPEENAHNPGRETVLLVSHEASRTGAPILSLNLVQALVGRYNVVVLLLDGGPLTEAFRLAGAVVAEPSAPIKGNIFMANFAVDQLCERFNFKFALVNSIESRIVLPKLGDYYVPTISLIHEFASYTRPRDGFRESLFWSGEVVFSANVTMGNAFAEYPDLGDLSVHILPQGRCLVPLGEFSEEQLQVERTLIRHLIRPADIGEDSVIVLGAGFVQLRKGVDLFIECAARVVHAPGGEKCRFVWIGKGYDPENDLSYSVYLADQIRRAGLQEHLFFIAETPAIEIAYEEADLFLLSSRLDPLPNVAIDAMAYGVPVLCFNKTTGIADFLIDSGLQDHCVAEYLDSADLAEKILALAGSQALRQQVGERCREASKAYFNMQEYVARLEVLAQGACARTQQEKADAQVILDSGLFRCDFSSPPHGQGQSIEAAVRRYLRAWASGIGRRKPFPGFNPGIYLEEHGLVNQETDPLADYLRAGRPEGPWNYPVIVAGETTAEDLPENQRVALHVHVYYPELLPEIITRLSSNGICPDLFISVTNEKNRELVASELSDYQGTVVDVQIVPNRGRDIGPLLTIFGQRILADYDYVGHIHTKKSADVQDADMGKRWYFFLLENLLGGESGPMADSILAKMKGDPSIGMVFPDDPYVVGWNANRAAAESLAARVGLQKLPAYFNFPVGTMFWARTSALAPLVNLNLDWSEYPNEPLPYDGTSLHAIERLFSLALSINNLRYAATNVKGVSR